jgi:ribose 5-phosphate isomerase B
MTTIVLGADHGGFELKEYIKTFLKSQSQFAVNDLGTHSLDSVDYPIFGKAVAEAVARGEAQYGILVCGTGIGISIAANKVNGIRAALVYDELTAKMSREHNNANVLCLGGRTTEPSKALKLVEIFLSTTFEGGRHQRRLDEIAAIESQL